VKSGELNPLRVESYNRADASHVGTIMLEPQVVAHAEEMFELLSDPAIYEFENSPPESLAWLEQRFTLLESRSSPDGAEDWLNWVVRLPDGALAGYVQATITRERTAHIAYELASRFWRRGIGSAAVSAMLAKLETSYDVRAIAATLKANNFRSLGLLQNLGFDAEPPPGLPVADCEHDEIVMFKAC
jgi:ribosomal-protein-alanine N-acetyltransferase